MSQYVALTKDSNLTDGVQTFQKAWESYHDAFLVARRPELHGPLNGQTLHGGATEQLYAAAEAAIDRLIDQNQAASRAETQTADNLASGLVTAMFLVSAASILFAAWILARIRSQITAPLGAITQALSRLAAGDRDIVVPELHRPDEIGELAKAFDIFRANAIESEMAHKETQKANQVALFQARHDLLTGLANRRFFAEEMQVAEAKLRDGAASFAVLLFDLDGFKAVNDLHGHFAGDQVLCEIARRLGRVIEKNDFLARLGGDEFAIIRTFPGLADPGVMDPGVTDRLDVSAMAEKLLAAIRLPIALGAHQIEIDASIGIALCPMDGWDASMALRAADIAMYCAKKEVRGAYRYFDPSMDSELRARAGLESALRKAIAAEHIRPYFQPIVDLQTQAIHGFEIQAHWSDPEFGERTPEDFLAKAEKLGLLSELTWSILRQACRAAAQWPENHRLSLNITPLQLADPLLPARLLATLNQEGFPPSRLEVEVEVTETALAQDVKRIKTTMEAIVGMGMKITLDDFGVGDSSLSHLRQFKFDKMKIDRSFVQAIAQDRESKTQDRDSKTKDRDSKIKDRDSKIKDRDSKTTVDAILGLSKSLSLSTVAEGIEDVATLAYLAERGCAFGQGNYFGEAVSAEEAGELLKRRSTELRQVA